MASGVPFQAKAHRDAVAIITGDGVAEGHRCVGHQGHNAGNLVARRATEAEDRVFPRKRYQVPMGYAWNQLDAEAFHFLGQHQAAVKSHPVSELWETLNQVYVVFNLLGRAHGSSANNCGGKREAFSFLVQKAEFRHQVEVLAQAGISFRSSAGALCPVKPDVEIIGKTVLSTDGNIFGRFQPVEGFEAAVVTKHIAKAMADPDVEFTFR